MRISKPVKVATGVLVDRYYEKKDASVLYFVKLRDGRTFMTWALGAYQATESMLNRPVLLLYYETRQLPRFIRISSAEEPQ